MNRWPELSDQDRRREGRGIGKQSNHKWEMPKSS